MLQYATKHNLHIIVRVSLIVQAPHLARASTRQLKNLFKLSFLYVGCQRLFVIHFALSCAAKASRASRMVGIAA
jgi:hypothetical protein